MSISVEIVPGHKNSQPVSTSMGMANRKPMIPEWQKEEYPVPREEPGVRTLDPQLLCWVREAVEFAARPTRPAGEIVRPQSDGSRVAWMAIDGNTGVCLWTFCARDFEAAKAEKDRLVLASGGRPGWVYLKRKKR
jgi:hypothetical protein